MARPGSLTERLTVLARTEETVRGVTTTTYEPGPKVWAEVKEQPGRDALRRGQTDAERPVLVTVRYMTGSSISSKDRFEREDGSVLNVKGRPRETGRKMYLEFLCVEVAD